MKGELPIHKPDLQIDFFYKLKEMKKKFFFQALRDSVKIIPISTIDKELSEYVRSESLSKVASFSLRGEVIFPVPCIILTNPHLIGYYRLFYGISRKEFYNKSFSKFSGLEDRGEISKKIEHEISPLCKSLISTGEIMVEALDSFSLESVSDLQLLTLGPQLRGGRNTSVGINAAELTFSIIKTIVEPYIVEIDELVHLILIKNKAHRLMEIKFSSDPDIVIVEKYEDRELPIVAIEIKGGRDYSNIHNRIGEAEKSHQKAKDLGFHYFWKI